VSDALAALMIDAGQHRETLRIRHRGCQHRLQVRLPSPTIASLPESMPTEQLGNLAFNLCPWSQSITQDSPLIVATG
jgi:hypothetical protein